MVDVLAHPEGSVTVTELDDGRREIVATAHDPDLFISEKRWVTNYDLDLIEHILRVKGVAYLNDEIKREEDPEYLKGAFEMNVFHFKGPETFAGKRVLDFGCGSGASTIVLSRMMPDAELVGIDLSADNISIAEHRARFYGMDHLKFHASTTPDHLSSDLGSFDYIILSAVYEHLLPDERNSLIPDIWNALRPHSILFINQTPNRYFPFEGHTTNLPLINFLPDNWAGALARRFSSRNLEKDDWETLLRKGIRGGSVRELNRMFMPLDGVPIYLEPNHPKAKDLVDLWFLHSASKRFRFLKRLVYLALKGIKLLTGITCLPTLTLAIYKS